MSDAEPLFPIPPRPFEYPTVHEYGYRHGRQLSHFLVDVTSRGRDALASALAIPFEDIVHGQLRATHAVVHPVAGLVLFQGDRVPADAIALDPPLTCAAAVDAVWAWLQRCPYGDDEHDGAVRPGFRVYNEQFGIVATWWDAFVAVLPMLIYIPK